MGIDTKTGSIKKLGFGNLSSTPASLLLLILWLLAGCHWLYIILWLGYKIMTYQVHNRWNHIKGLNWSGPAELCLLLVHCLTQLPKPPFPRQDCQDKSKQNKISSCLENGPHEWFHHVHHHQQAVWPTATSWHDVAFICWTCTKIMKFDVPGS